MAHGDVAPGALLSEPESHSERVQLPPLQPPGDVITPSVCLDPIFPLGATGLAQLSLPAAGGGVAHTAESSVARWPHTQGHTRMHTPPRAWAHGSVHTHDHIHAHVYTHTRIHTHTSHRGVGTRPPCTHTRVHTSVHTWTQHVCTRECAHRHSRERRLPQVQLGRDRLAC